jgi:hypothetical protein
MSTVGVNPVQLALRDVGVGFGALLTDEAKRRQDALAMQQQQGSLALAQQQLTNQSQVATAEGQVNLAKVGLQGREFDVTTGLKRDELAQQKTFQGGQLEIQREHNRLLGLQETRLGPLTTQQTEVAKQQAEKQRLDNLADSQPVFVEDLEKGLRAQLAAQGMPPDQIEQNIAQGKHIWDNVSSAAHLPIDPASGKPYMTQGQANARLKYAVDLDKLTKRETLTADQVAKHRGDFLKETKDDPGMANLSYVEKGAIADALLLHNKEYYAATQTLLSPRIEAFRKEQIAKLEQRDNRSWTGTVTPATADQIKQLERDIITPQIYRWRADIAMGLVGGGGGKPVTQPPPGSGTAQPKAALEGMAGTVAQTYGFRPAQVQGLVDIENGKWDPKAVNGTLGAEGGVGLGQQIKSTFGKYGPKGGDRTNPADSLETMGKHLTALKEIYGDDMARVYAAYHSGEGKIPKAGPIPETVTQQSSKGPFTQYPRAYAAKVMAAVARREAATGSAPGPATTPTPPPGNPVQPPPPFETGPRPGGDFSAASPPRPMPPLQPPRSPLDPLLAPLVQVPGWAQQLGRVPAAIGEAMLPRGTRTPAPSVPPPSLAGAGIPAVPETRLQGAVLMELQRRYSRQGRIPDGVHAVFAGDDPQGQSYGTLLVTTQNGQIVRVEKGA